MAASMDRSQSDLFSSNSSVASGLDGEFKVYKRRWFILIVVFLLNITNGMVRFTKTLPTPYQT